MDRAVVCGAGGFIGHHLTGLLKREGLWVRGVDIKEPEFAPSAADEFLLIDLREPESARRAVDVEGRPADQVYQLAADMGGMGFIDSAECEIMTNSALINLHMVNAAARAGVPRYFFSSSACVYPDQRIGDGWIGEEAAYPARPDNEYGWEKLYAERVALAFGRNRGMEVRVARFQNCFGPYGTWRGGREKAPAAICRKVAMAEDGGEVEVWGDGTALRDYIYVDDLCAGILALMRSDIREPTNIGTERLVSVNELVGIVSEIAGKSLTVRHVSGPVGVQARYHRVEIIRSTGWSPRVSLEEGLRRTYAWIDEQVRSELTGARG